MWSAKNTYIGVYIHTEQLYEYIIKPKEQKTKIKLL